MGSELRIVTFSLDAPAPQRPGLVLDGYVVDVSEAWRVRDLTERRTWAGDSTTDRFGEDGSALIERLAAEPQRWDELRDIGTWALETLGTRADVNAVLPHLHPLEDVHLGPALPRPGKLICTGMNFRDLVDSSEGRLAAPAKPKAFLKSTNTLCGAYDDIPHPSVTKQLDYEVELGVVIGRRCRQVAPEDVHEVVAGYVVVNDFSARDIQYAEMATGLLFLGKNLDGLCPLGPWVLAGSEIDVDSWTLSLHVNGERRQHAALGDMMFSIADLVAHFSMITLEPGDIITSGTPTGVVSSLQGVPYLQPGDVVRTSVEGVGTMENVITPPGPAPR